jgi:hypothetical protein
MGMPSSRQTRYFVMPQDRAAQMHSFAAAVELAQDDRDARARR